LGKEKDVNRPFDSQFALVDLVDSTPVITVATEVSLPVNLGGGEHS